MVTVKRCSGQRIGIEPLVGRFLAYIEYPSHYLNGLDSPVGLAFAVHVEEGQLSSVVDQQSWFTEPPDRMHAEQRDFLVGHGLMRS